MRRSLRVAMLLGVALALAGCAAQITGTGNVTTDSADLNVTAHCDQGQV